MTSISEQQLESFMSLFRGRTDVYARRWEKDDSFEGKLVQYIGRLRDSGNQKTIIDYRDSQILFLEKQFKQRQRYYKKLKAKIDFI